MTRESTDATGAALEVLVFPLDFVFWRLYRSFATIHQLQINVMLAEGDVCGEFFSLVAIRPQKAGGIVTAKYTRVIYFFSI